MEREEAIAVREWCVEQALHVAGKSLPETTVEEVIIVARKLEEYILMA